MNRSEPLFYVLVQPEGAAEAERVDLTDRVLSFEYEDSEKKADLLKLSVNNWDLSNFDDPVWRKGNKLIVSWGYPGNMAPPRECIIQKVTGAQTLSIEAQSKAVLMNKEVKNRVFETKTRAQVVRDIAAENGYEDNADIEETNEVFDTINQARSTDAQFLKRLADLEGFEFYVDFDGLHWHQRRMGQKPLRVLQWYLPPDVGDILSFNVENDIFAKPGAVTTKGRDPLNKKDITGEAKNATVERDATAPVPEIVDPQTGALTLGKNTASAEVRPTTETTEAQVKREADGVFRRVQQTAVDLTIEMVGDPGVFAKSVLDARGLGKRLSGLYYVKQCNHKLDSSGYKLSLKTSSDGTHGHVEVIAGSLTSSTGGSGTPTKEAVEACKALVAAKQDELIAVTSGTNINLTKAKQLEQELAALKKKCAAMAGAVTMAKVNENKGEPASEADQGKLAQVEKVDPETGQTVVVFKDLGGKTGAQDGKTVK